MATYNPMSALSVTARASADALGLGVNVNHPGGAGSLSLEGFDRDNGFDEILLENVNALAPLPFTPAYDFDAFSSTFEDPFPYSTGPAGRPYDHLAPHDGEGGFHESASPQEEGLDNKLLGFSEPVVKAAVLDDAGQFSEPAMSAELFGMFFLAEDVYAADNTGRPLELTCYRRNLWWCSGQITLPRQITHAVTDQGRQLAVLELAASITAVESIEGKPTEIICIPWKSTAASGAASTAAATGTATGGGNSSSQHEDTKAAGSPPNLLIDLANGQELDNGLVSVPISWKRLQFKHATANNGRRKGQQQHYVVQINLLARVKPDSASGSSSSSSSSSSGGSGIIKNDANTATSTASAAAAAATASGKDGEDGWLKIAEVQSGPVIVRGRSPRNFVSRRDVPLTGSAGGSASTGDKKQPQQQLQFDRSTGLDAAVHQQHQQHQPQHRGSTGSSSAELQSFQRYNSLGSVQSADWAHSYAQQSPHPPKKVLLSPSLTRPPVPPWDTPSRLSKMLPQHQQQQQQQQQLSQQHPHQLKQQHHQHHQQQHLQHHQQQQYPYQQPPPKRANSSTAIPLNLSLSEDERSPNRLGTDPPYSSPPFSHVGSSVSASTLSGKSATAAAKMASSNSCSSTANNTANSTAAVAGEGSFEDNDLLYEYFPLSLDDWMPPVDAVYRPHVVHHTVVPPEVKAQQVRNKTKRYFAAE